jgi:diaminohydroxyphosphoribosylaminopyrimidine deaminase/5-amino-6-(5-phosphoribosylamino)uracil reductase
MNDAELMRRAMDLALRGRGRVEPNPMVGCVLFRDGKIIAEGYHEYFGGPHAEANALAACRDAAGATAFTTLEPCCHLNKKTPPCTRALIGAKIRRVVGAMEDPNPSVAGKGFEELRQAGIEVEAGLMEEEAKELNAAYLKLVGERRPYVTLKWAQTADGKIAGAEGKRLAISNPFSLGVMHALRSRCDAVMVGIGTVISDDPLLTARVANPPRRPVRIVLDSALRIGLESQLIKSAHESPVMVCCSEGALKDCAGKAATLRARGVELLPLKLETGGLSLQGLLDELGARRMTHLLVEPGPTLAESFLHRNLADRVWIFQSTKLVNEATAPSAPAVDYRQSGAIDVHGDTLIERLKTGRGRPSPDFELARAEIGSGDRK